MLLPQIITLLVATSKFNYIPNSLSSSVVYINILPDSVMWHIGETRKQVKVRICQHKSISPRTGRRTSIPLIENFILAPLKKTIPYMKMILKLLPGAEKPLLVVESIFIQDFKLCLYDNKVLMIYIF